MKERPILFSAPMVRAILAGTKTQTRRALKHQPPHDHASLLVEHIHPTVFRRGEECPGVETFGVTTADGEWCLPCPYGQPGDYLWVKETFQWFSEDGNVLYKANPKDDVEMRELKFDGCLEAFWRPSIFMPRRLSRITLEITDIRVERLQDISEADAMAEGIVDAGDGNGYQLADTTHYSGTARESYASLWESINGAGSWDSNPFVWVVSFKRV